MRHTTSTCVILLLLLLLLLLLVVMHTRRFHMIALTSSCSTTHTLHISMTPLKWMVMRRMTWTSSRMHLGR
eukprot:04653.XXX_149267_149479_1 [CDS] Oithona nana genome sequencing.